MISIAVCEDEVFLGSQMEMLLYRFAEESGVSIETEVFVSAEQCLRYIKEEKILIFCFWILN